MPRKPTVFNDNAILTLRHLIKIKSNLNCRTFSDIQLLHEDILRTTSVYLSVQTLNRVLGVIKSDFRPSLHTLDTLAKYLNYNSFNDLQVVHESEGLLRQEKTEFINSFFASVFAEINPANENSLYEVVKNILMWMGTHDNFLVNLYSSVAAGKHGRNIFFNSFVNIDAFNNGFGAGLHYYLLHAQEKEERFFGYILNCYRYFLNGETELFKTNFRFIKHYPHSEMVRFRPELIDRFYGIVILNKYLSPAEENDTDDPPLLDFDMLTSSSLSLSNSNYFVGEALMLTGDFERAYEIFSTCNIKDLHVPEILKNDYALQIKIFRLISGFLANKISHRRTLAQYLEIYKLPLPFLQENYLSLFILFSRFRLFNRPKIRMNIMESITRMIEKTGFYFFNSYFDKINPTVEQTRKKLVRGK